jgi:hypothetical protein
MCSTCEFQKGKNRKFEIIMEENNGVTPPYVVHWLINCAIFIYFREHIHCKYFKKKY